MNREYRFLFSMTFGAVLFVLSGMRYAVEPLAWVAFAPLLAPFFIESGRKLSLWLLAVLAVAAHISVAKIITPPLSYLLVPMFALPGAIVAWLAVLLSGAAYRRFGIRWGVYFFPSSMVTLEWLQYTYTSQSGWGALGFSQTQNLPLIQFTSLFGIAGLSFLVALGSSLIAAVFVHGARRLRLDIAFFVALLIGVHLYGQIRLSQKIPGTPIRIATVASPFSSEATREMIENPALARRMDEELFLRTSRAADLGARVAVWNEAGTILEPRDEPRFTDRAKVLAKEKTIDIVLAYAVLKSTQPLRFENKYLWVRADGSVADEYWKRFPVPGEGSIPGKSEAKVISFPEGKLTGGICYDYDFPVVARSHARAGAGLSVLPSSDWRGIDPLHSDMARIMGVAAGVSVVRSVRSATSFASDPFGRLLGTSRFYDRGDGIMVADVPAIQIPTLYSRIGDVLPLFTAAFSLLVMLALAYRWCQVTIFKNAYSSSF